MAWYLVKRRYNFTLYRVICWTNKSLYMDVLLLKYVCKVQVTLKLALWLTKHHAMKTYWSGGVAPHILDLGIRRRWVVNFAPRQFYTQGKSPRFPLDRRLGGPQSLSENVGEAKNSQFLPEIEPRSSSLNRIKYVYLLCYNPLGLTLS
jgi:hypothetical protein